MLNRRDVHKLLKKQSDDIVFLSRLNKKRLSVVVLLVPEKSSGCL